MVSSIPATITSARFSAWRWIAGPGPDLCGPLAAPAAPFAWPPEDNKTNQLVFLRSMLKGLRILGSGTGRNGAPTGPRPCACRGPIIVFHRHFHAREWTGWMAALRRFAPMRPKRACRASVIAMTAPPRWRATGAGLAARDRRLHHQAVRKSDLHQMIRAHAPEGMSPVRTAADPEIGLSAASQPGRHPLSASVRRYRPVSTPRRFTIGPRVYR